MISLFWCKKLYYSREVRSEESQVHLTRHSAFVTSSEVQGVTGAPLLFLVEVRIVRYQKQSPKNL